MKILITGGAGYVGGYMTDWLIEMGHDVTVYDSLVYETRYLKPVPFIRGDVRDKDKLEGIIHDFDVIILLAAIVGDAACALDPFLTESINFDSVKWIVDNFNGKIIFASTCSVYGKNTDPVGVGSPVDPLSVYAKTKYQAEQYILFGSAMPPLVFRLGTLYGVGDTYSRVRFDLVANVLSKLAAENKLLTVFGGDQWRPLLHVRDVAGAVNHGLKNNMSGLYDLTSGNYTIRQLAEEIKLRIPGTQISYTAIPFEDERNYQVSDVPFAKLGWTADYSLKDGILEIQKLIDERRLKDVDAKIYSNYAYLKNQIKPL
jgi:nucleoside-diphosphate-sugar epimerase